MNNINNDSLIHKKCKFGHNYDIRFDECPFCDTEYGADLEDRLLDYDQNKPEEFGCERRDFL